MAATGAPSSDYLESPANYRLGFVSLLAAGIGVAAGFVAFLIYHLIGLLTNLFFYQRISFSFVAIPEEVSLWVLIIPAIGGLIVGVMAKYGSPRIIGHGIPEAMEAVWKNKSRIRPRIMFLKPISAAIAIGTGAPFGVEGPIIQTGGTMGSGTGQWLGTTEAERKVLLGCGAAAGMAATFNTPIAAVLLAIELLLFEFKSRSFIPLGIATVLAVGVREPLLGGAALLGMPAVEVNLLHGLPFLILLGVVLGIAAVLFKRGFFWTEDQFDKIPADNMWLPAIGGLGLGVVGYFVPEALGVGYEVTTGILSNEYTVTMLLVIMGAKTLALYLSLGSKTSGGLLAPMFVVGAAIGAVLATGVNAVIPGATISPGLFALAGVGILFGVSARATFAFILFPVEVTGQYEALLPIFLVGVVADGIASMYLGHSIMTEKLVRRGVHISQEYEIDVLKRFSVEEVMDPVPATVRPGMTVRALVDKIIDEEHRLQEGREDHEHLSFPIVDSEKGLAGIITNGDLMHALAREDIDKTVLEAGVTDLVVGYPDELLHHAVVKMSVHKVGQLPIVSRSDRRKLIGHLGARDAMSSALRRMEEEHLREERGIRRDRERML